METIPVSKTCPSCGNDQYRKVRSKRRISFADDRICMQCDTRYAPPTPRWAGIFFVIFGVIAFGVGALVSTFAILSPAKLLAQLIYGIPLVMIGGASIVHGVRAISNSGSV